MIICRLRHPSARSHMFKLGSDIYAFQVWE